MHSCSYCDRVFNSYQALGGHLKAHRNMMRRYPNYRSPNNSIDGTIPYFNLLKSLGTASSGALMNNHCVSREDPRENETELILSSYLSYATNRNASPRALALSGGLMPSVLPLCPPMYMVYPNDPLGLAPYGGSIGFCHFNVDALRYFINRFPYLSKRFLYIMKYHNSNNHPYSSCVPCSLCPYYMMNKFLKFRDFIPHPGLDINKFLGMKNPVFAGLLPPAQAQLASSFCPNDNIRGLTSGRVKKRCLCQAAANAVMIRAPKRPRVSSSSQVCWVRKPPHNELLLFKDVNNSFPGSEISIDGEEKYEANLDLSLHL